MIYIPKSIYSIRCFNIAKSPTCLSLVWLGGKWKIRCQCCFMKCQEWWIYFYWVFFFSLLSKLVTLYFTYFYHLENSAQIYKFLNSRRQICNRCGPWWVVNTISVVPPRTIQPQTAKWASVLHIVTTSYYKQQLHQYYHERHRRRVLRGAFSGGHLSPCYSTAAWEVIGQSARVPSRFTNKVDISLDESNLVLDDD